MTGQTSMVSFREKMSLAALFFVYFVCSVRYFPGRPAATFTSTALHLLEIAPFTLGAVIVVTGVVRKFSGRKPGGIALVRVFLTISLIAEFFFGLYTYLERGSAVVGG